VLAAVVGSGCGSSGSGDRDIPGEDILKDEVLETQVAGDAGEILLPDPSFWEEGDPCGPLTPVCSNDGHCKKGEVCYAAQCIAPVQVWLWPGWPDLDYDGEPDQPAEKASGGEGVFAIHRGKIDEFGATIQWNRAALHGTTFKAEGVEGVSGILSFSLPDSGEPLVVESRQARYMGEVEIKGGALWTIEEKDGTLGGLKMGGFAPLSDIMEQLDGYARKCECAGIDPESPVIESKIEGGKWSSKCVQTSVVTGTPCDAFKHGWVCSHLSPLCAALPIFGAVADVSSGAKGEDGTTALDSISFGLRMSMVKATLATPPFTLARFATDDKIEVWQSADEVLLHVLENDGDAVTGTPRVASVTQPAHGKVTVENDGTRVVLQKDPAFDGLDQFTYTIEGESEKGTATVLLLIRKPLPQAEDDELDATLNRGPVELDVLANDHWDQSDDQFVRIDGPSNVSESGAFGWTTPDQRLLVISPAPDNYSERTVEFQYGLMKGISGGKTMAAVKLKLKRPPVKCGDKWVDPWDGETCDDGNTKDGDGCDAACHFEACPGGTEPLKCFVDADQDGYGDQTDLSYSCECPAGSVTQGGDCRDDLINVNPGWSETGVEMCADGIDNNCGFGTDCGSMTCEYELPCGESGTACSNGKDDDGDGAKDCEDPDCNGILPCREQDCTDGLDDEGDGWPDCFDYDCMGSEACPWPR